MKKKDKDEEKDIGERDLIGQKNFKQNKKIRSNFKREQTNPLCIYQFCLFLHMFVLFI